MVWYDTLRCDVMRFHKIWPGSALLWVCSMSLSLSGYSGSATFSPSCSNLKELYVSVRVVTLMLLLLMGPSHSPFVSCTVSWIFLSSALLSLSQERDFCVPIFHPQLCLLQPWVADQAVSRACLVFRPLVLALLDRGVPRPKAILKFV